MPDASREIDTYHNPTSLQPRDLGEAMTLAKTLATSGLVPDALRGKPADVLVIMMYGMELGLSVNQAMRGIHVIKGRPSLSTELRVSKTRERGHRVGVVCVCGEWADYAGHGDPTDQDPGRHPYNADWTDQRCTVKAVRRDSGETSIVTWTVQDAVRAGLLWPGKGDLEGRLIARSSKSGEILPWEAYTRDMLYNRAADRACKQIAPEVAYGLYTPEEAAALPDEEPTRVEATVGEPVTAPDVTDAAAEAARLQAEYETS